MFDKMKNSKFLNTQQLEDILDKFHKKQLFEKKKNYTWLIVTLIVVGLAAIGFGIYKFFFAPIDDYDDYEDDFEDDIDYDEDYDDEEDEIDEDEEEREE
ncbi:MAG: DUF4366 domain-containing protein [Vallitaleaceae bacterium]|nr:DUF4366 domain-containing protein [Vallitaleaceae bacterium]